MRKLHVLLIACASFLCTSILPGQVTFTTPDLTVEQGNPVNVDIQVENFDSITSVQFSINWDPTVLQFVEVTNFGLDGLDLEDHFGLTEVEQGIIRLSWFQGLVLPTSLDDGSVIFTIVMNAVGANGTSTQVEITDEPIDIEVGDENGLPVDDLVIENGTITIDMVDPTFETETLGFILYQNSPNPFKTETNISFELKSASQAALSIYTKTGKLIFEEKNKFGSGSHTINLKRHLFPTAGTYLYQLKTIDYTATRKLVVQ